MHAIFFDPPLEQNYIGHQFSEIYRDGIYSAFVEGMKDLTILDIGANIGITSYYFSQFAKAVYSIEPAKEHFEKINKMIEFNKIKNIKTFNQAIYIKNGKFPLFHNDNKTMYSLHQAFSAPGVETETVECITLDRFMEANKIKEIDLMKMDIEGSEPEIFGHSGFRKVANKIKTIIFENHQWSGRHPNQIKESLESLGYKVGSLPSDASIMVAER